MLKISRAGQTTQSLSNTVGQAVSVGGGGGGLPLTIAGLKLWLDANDESTITKDGSDLVSQWDDKSEEGNNVVQATGSSQPLWVENIQNSLPIIRFDGVNDNLKRATYVNGELTQPNTIFYVGQIGADEDFTLCSGTSGKEHDIFTTLGNLSAYAGLTYGSDTRVSTLRQYTFLFSSTSSTMRVNGTQTDSGNVGTEAMNGITVGARFIPNQFADIDVCEILVYNADVSDEDRDLLEAYLIEKWGIS